MSWIGEEWKKELSNDALEHVKSLEDCLTKFKHEVTQWQFRYESLESQNENYKQKCESQQKEIKNLERQQVNLEADLEKKVKEYHSLNIIVQQKESLVKENYENIANLKNNLACCQDEKGKIQVELKKLNEELESCRIAAKASNSKANILENSNNRQIEDLKKRLENEEKSHRQTELAYESKLKESCDKEKFCIKENDALRKEIQSLELKIFSLEKDKGSMREMLDELERQKRDVMQMKISNNNDDENVGEYLGIHVRKFKSDSKIEVVDHEKTQLLKENKELVVRIEQLEDELKTLSKRNNDEKTLKQKPMVDSGLVLHGASYAKRNEVLTEINEVENEVIITRIEGTDDSSEADSILFESSEKMETAAGDNVGTTYFVDVALLESFKDENMKLKEEISQMKDVYENHMRVCSGVAGPRKSIERLNSYSEQRIEELMQRLHDGEDERKTLLKHLENQQLKHDELERTLRCFSQSNKSLEKLNELVDLIKQKKSPKNEKVASRIDVQQLHNDITSNIGRLFTQIENAHDTTRSFIKNFISNALEEKILPLKSSMTRCVCASNNKKTGHSAPRITVNRSACLQDLETMKNQIESVQQLVQSYESELRSMESDRTTLQEEVVKLMELVKKKDHKIGQLNCDYEKEKRKVEESDHCFKMEMSALKHEQLQVYEEFREMCESLKRKDIELLNKTKQIKTLNAEAKEKEKSFEEKMEEVEKHVSEYEQEKTRLEKELRECQEDNKLLLNRLDHCCEHLQQIFNNLSRIEKMFLQVKPSPQYT